MISKTPNSFCETLLISTICWYQTLGATLHRVHCSMFTLGASTGTPSQVRINSKPKEQLCNYHKLSSLKPKNSVTRLCSHRKAFPAPEEAWCSTARLCSEIDTWQGSLPNTMRPQVSQSHLNNQIWSPRSFKCLQNCDFNFTQMTTYP